MQQAMKDTALVTGASSGIGAEFARLLAQRGIDLILTARRVDRLEALRNELQAEHKVAVEIIACDLSAERAAQNLYESVKSKNRAVSILINNAGFGMLGDFAAMDPVKLEEMIRLNITSLTLLTRLFVADMQAKNHGYILQVSSIGGFQPSPYFAAYSATKAYVLSFGEALAGELRGSGVSVTTLYPGNTATEFADVARAKLQSWMEKSAMPARKVATIGIEALFARRVCVTAGLPNKLNALFIKLIPRRLAAWLASVVGKMLLGR